MVYNSDVGDDVIVHGVVCVCVCVCAGGPSENLHHVPILHGICGHSHCQM